VRRGVRHGARRCGVIPPSLMGHGETNEDLVCEILDDMSARLS
jgi:hypothetical protein